MLPIFRVPTFRIYIEKFCVIINRCMLKNNGIILNGDVIKMQENKMGVMPVGKLLINMSLPMMISMLVQALYNIVDSIFVAQLGEYAVRSVSLVFPAQTLMIALATGTSVGVNALLSKSLGEREFDKANRVAANGVFLAVAGCVLVAVLGSLFARAFIHSQTDVAQVRTHGVAYMIICCSLSVGVFVQIMFERLLQSTGKTMYTMITQGTGALINIIMDPILIFGWFGFPKLEVAGAAIATVTGQMVAAGLAIFFNLKYNHEIKMKIKSLRPDMRLIGQIYKVGAPSVIMQSIGSLMTYGINLILASFGVAQTVFGLYFKLQSFIFLPVFGLNNGMVPIIAYNYGAGRRDRVLKTMKLSICFAVSIMLVGLVVMELFPGQLLLLFNADQELLKVGIPALRIICLSFVFAGFCIVVGSVFQALGNGIYSMITSISRQMLVLLPVAYLLSLTGVVSNIWWSFPIAELMSLAMSTYFLWRINKKVISRIGEGA